MSLSNFLTAVATANPEYRYSAETLKSAAAEWLGAGTAHFQLFDRLANAMGLRNRHYVIPHQEVLSLAGMKSRAEHFAATAPPLLIEAASQALALRNVSGSDIQTLVYSSCTLPSIPSIDTFVVDAVGLRRTVRRVPMYQQGCAGGVVGLSLSNALATTAPVMLCCVELCSLVLYPDDLASESILSAVLFGDGAATAIVEPARSRDELKGGEGNSSQRPLRFVDTQSYLLPNARHIMGYRVEDNGPHLLLDRALPDLLADQVPKIGAAFLERNGLTAADVKWWLFHPGGTKILESFEGAFKLSREQTRWAWEVLSEDGNMSSVTILYTLKAFLDSNTSKPGDKILVAGIGPGLTVELVLLEG